MSEPFSRGRKICVAVSALFLSAVLFRTQIAGAIVARGDDLLVRGNKGSAMRYYERALIIDPSTSLAADRLAFTLLQQRTSQSLLRCVATVTEFFARNRADSELLADRALCFLLLHRYAAAEDDFRRAASASIINEPRNEVFAGWCAWRERRREEARALWRAALHASPRYRPAAIALAEHGR